MMWVLQSIFSAVTVSASDALGKKVLQTHTSKAVAFIRPGWASLFLIPLLFWAPAPSNSAEFWWNLALAIPLEIVAALMFNRALQISPLSIVMPYLAFTPVFLLGIEWLVLGESFSVIGGAGIFLVAGGALILQAPMLEAKKPSFKRLLVHEKGPLLMLGVSIIYAVTSVLAKKAVVASNAPFFCATYFPLTALGILLTQERNVAHIKTLVNKPGLFATLGFLDAAALLSQFYAFAAAEAAYVVAIKRSSLLLSVVWGWIFFGEKKSLTRLAGAAVMTIGAGLIALK
jgi:drug/metabolite transporter (DMT)-like permease